MLNLSPFDIQRVMRSSLLGTFANDPVVPERPRRRRRDGESPVHLHAHTDDRAEVCHDTNCSRPRLQLAP